MEHAETDAITRAEFARRRNVTRGRVSQWISEGKISGAAIVGAGRDARIVEALAVQQLRTNINVQQRYGRGLATSLQMAPDVPAVEHGRDANAGMAERFAAANALDTPPLQDPVRPIALADPVEEKIKTARLEELQRRNRKAAEEEAARAGRLVEAEAATMQYGKIASQMIAVMDGALTRMAGAMAARFQVPQRDALHLLRSEFRDVRAAAADALKRLSVDMPDMIELELPEDIHIAPAGNL